MEKDKLLRMIKEVIFEKVGEFNGLNRPESITNNDELDADMALDFLDFVEVVMEMEKRTGRCIPDEVLDVKPYYELTVGEIANMLYNYLKDYEKR
jgi:acyl carrier protein